ncbi:hypothetical protein [Kribbella shirazensis]|uniref:Uncharacterized protein n=1 Tax=Kribbella shirazensis TaxID=1105143 RepID=A0A7X6A1V2_9ACTN|nr:hypothetical protein [Kribbella shirazensis]NIK58220.1 hypothetical protein [Kribbella shirazensis]
MAGPDVFLNDALHTAAIEHLTGKQSTPPFVPVPTRSDAGLSGEYASFQRHQNVRAEGGKLLVDTTTLFYDEDHRRILGIYGGFGTTTETYVGIAPGQYMIDGTDPQTGLRFTPNHQYATRPNG